MERQTTLNTSRRLWRGALICPAQLLCRPCCLDTCKRRTVHVLRASDVTLPCNVQPMWFPGPAKEALQPYVAFQAALRSAHMGFVSRLETQARTLLRHHLDTATSEFALSLLMSTVSLEPAAPYQQQAAGMPPPVSRRAQAAADEGENMPPQEDAADEGQVRCGHLGEQYRPLAVVPGVPSRLMPLVAQEDER